MSTVRLIADDLTGALDTAAELVPLAGPIPVRFKAGATGFSGSLAIDMGTREASAAVAHARAAGFSPVLAEADIAYVKVDSLLRGHPMTELAANAPAVREKTAAVLSALGAAGRAAHGAIVDGVTRWCADLGIEMRLSRLGVPEADLPIMATQAHAIRRLLDNNPLDLTRDEILHIYRNAF